MTFKEQLAYRAKAILAGVGLIAVGFAEWLVENPDTAKAIEHVVPAPYTQFVPLILAGIATALVHRIPNAAAPLQAGVVTEPTTDTTILRLSELNGGEFIGDPAH